jgi:hypothetical protein
MLEARGGLRLALEALDELLVLREAVVEDLDRDVSIDSVSAASQTSAIPPAPIFRSSR